LEEMLFLELWHESKSSIHRSGKCDLLAYAAAAGQTQVMCHGIALAGISCSLWEF